MAVDTAAMDMEVVDTLYINITAARTIIITIVSMALTITTVTPSLAERSLSGLRSPTVTIISIPGVTRRLRRWFISNALKSSPIGTTAPRRRAIIPTSMNARLDGGWCRKRRRASQEA